MLLYALLVIVRLKQFLCGIRANLTISGLYDAEIGVQVPQAGDLPLHH